MGNRMLCFFFSSRIACEFFLNNIIPFLLVCVLHELKAEANKIIALMCTIQNTLLTYSVGYTLIFDRMATFYCIANICIMI